MSVSPNSRASKGDLTVALAAALLASACAGDAPRADVAGADLVLEHAAVVDVETGELRMDQSIYIAGNRIVAVMPSGEAPAPAANGAAEAGPTAVDASGQYVIPGLWDAHVHSAGGAAWHFPLLIAHGVTSVRNLHTTSDTALNLTNAIKRRIAAGEIVGPRFLANGPIVDGLSSWPGTVVVRTETEGRAAVDSLAAGGADFIKVYDTLVPDAYRGIMAAARERGIPVDGHVPFAVSPLDAAAAGQRTVEHLSGISIGCSSAADSLRAEYAELVPRLPSMQFPENAVSFFRLVRAALDTRDPALCAATVAAYREAGVTVVPTLVIGGSGPAIVADSALMSWLPVGVQEDWRTIAGYGPDPIAEVFATGEDHSPANLRLLHEAGVPILAGTDVGNPFLVPGASLHDELGLLVDAGLTPLEALRAATISPARTFGLADSLGVVGEGKLADLVLLGSNPLDDIGAARDISGVVLNGRYLDRQALDGLLTEAAAAPAGD